MKKSSFLFYCLLLCSLLNAQEQDERTDLHGNTVSISGLFYRLNEMSHTAMIANTNQWTGELDIPEEVNYNNQKYTVNGLEWQAFNSCKTLTKVRIPKSVITIEHYAGNENCKNPFNNCTSLESIEVAKDNPSMCSVNGVLFSKDKTRLFCYPAGAKNEDYSVPDGVTWIGSSAFAYNSYIVHVAMPNSVISLSSGVFSNCKSLKSVSLSECVSYIGAYTFEKCESLYLLDIPESVTEFGESVFRWSPIKTLVIRGSFPQGLRNDTFVLMDDDVTFYVRQSEIENFKKVYSGTVLPLESYSTDITNASVKDVRRGCANYDLLGRRQMVKPSKGVYIESGRKKIK